MIVGGRYYLSGTQLGILKAHFKDEFNAHSKTLLDEIETNQFMGNRGDDVFFVNGMAYVRRKGKDYHEPVNKFKSKATELIKILGASRTAKRKAGWSRMVGAGFISQDIKDIERISGNVLKFSFKDGHVQNIKVPDLNLRETEEALLFAEWLDIKLQESALHAKANCA